MSVKLPRVLSSNAEPGGQPPNKWRGKTRKPCPAVRSLLFVLIFIAAIATSPFAAELNVPSQYSSIQAAIDAAQTGDTMIVQPGIYTENIDFHGKAVTVSNARKAVA